MVPSATSDYYNCSVELHHWVLLPETICKIVIIWYTALDADSFIRNFDISHDIMFGPISSSSAHWWVTLIQTYSIRHAACICIHF